MSKSYATYTGDGSTRTYTFSFDYLDQSHVKATVNGVEVSFTFNSANTITLTTAPAAGTVVRIFRDTPGTPLVDFENGSIMLADNLDKASTQAIYRAQEAVDIAGRSIFQDNAGQWDAKDRRVVNVADPVDAQDAVTKNWAETAMSSQVAQAITARQAAETAQIAAEAARSGAETAEVNAEVAQAASEAARDASQAAQAASEAARDAAQSSATAASGSASTASAAASTATSVRDTTLGYRNEADQFRAAAASSAAQAQSFANLSLITDYGDLDADATVSGSYDWGDLG